MTSFKPMLAATIEQLKQLEGRYPLIASPKLDGVRAFVKKTDAGPAIIVSRNLKPIPNHHVQMGLPLELMENLDGELIVGSQTDPECFRKTTSGVMSKDGEPDFTFYVFDMHSQLGFDNRLRAAQILTDAISHPRIRMVPHVTVHNEEELLEYEQQCLSVGYEGVMLRAEFGDYKYGRSTVREGGLMKLKRFEDSEAVIVGFEEQMQNNNEATRDALGRTERSSHKANMSGKGTLGALIVHDINTRVAFNIGTGFDDAMRQEIWFNRNTHYLGKIIKYKHFPSGGKDKPRFPVFLGFRAEGDMSTGDGDDLI